MNRREMIDSGLRDIVRILPAIAAVAGLGGIAGLMKKDAQPAEVTERPKCFPSAKEDSKEESQ